MNVNFLYPAKTNPNMPKLSPGDTVKVTFKVKEATKERLQTLPGLVIKLRKAGNGGSFTIRRVTSGVGVEHTFPFASPLLDKVEVVRHGKVRRAKLYYIRRLSTKDARLKERREKLEEAGITPEMVTPVNTEIAETPGIQETTEAAVTQEAQITKES
jgi:large subunit ribosomal protein L19